MLWAHVDLSNGLVQQNESARPPRPKATADHSATICETADVRTVQCTIDDYGNTVVFSAEKVRVSISAVNEEALNLFLTTHSRQLVDFLVARALLPDAQPDVLWVAPANDDHVWLVSVAMVGDSDWQGQVSHVRRPAGVATDYLLDPDLGRSNQVLDLYAAFSAWSPTSYLVDPARSLSSLRLLSLKAEPSEQWLLRVPFTQFAQLSLGQFAAYCSIECVVTSRGFTQLAISRHELRDDFLNAETLLTRTIVVVNTYGTHRNDPKWQEATDLVRRVLSLFGNVSFGAQRRSLRWYFNPPRDTLSALLSDRVITYVFADFNADDDRWQIGEGPYSDWERSAQDVTGEDGWNFEPEWFDLGEADLAHIRLMRLFHCHSMFNAYNGDTRQPADARSIVRKLLSAGAQRVEGAMTRENYFDYLCTVLSFLCCPTHLHFILTYSCLQRGIDPIALLFQINALLSARGFPVVSHGTEALLKETQ